MTPIDPRHHARIRYADLCSSPEGLAELLGYIATRPERRAVLRAELAAARPTLALGEFLRECAAAMTLERAQASILERRPPAA